MYRRNNFKRNTYRRTTNVIKKPRRVGLTVATSYLEISDWNALSDIAENIIRDIEIRTGCRKEHIDWHISDVAGEIEITFTPFRTNVDTLKKQLQSKYSEYTFTISYDSVTDVTTDKDEDNAE